MITFHVDVTTKQRSIGIREKSNETQVKHRIQLNTYPKPQIYWEFTGMKPFNLREETSLFDETNCASCHWIFYKA